LGPLERANLSPQVGEENTQLGPLKRANLYPGVFPPHLRTETDPVSETSCFLFSRIPDDGKFPKKHSNSVYHVPSCMGIYYS
jgi:hypothetical protein